ncbi:MAG: T9SS type A sorting domain-containing protein, partial [Polaribacter sp.]|nr:T9SS type A sorting domain-containing protein [Polaribacter sp.]
ESTYDENGNRTLWILYDWNTDSQSFVPYYKNESTYDENGNRTLVIGYDWDTDTQSFVNFYRDELAYDANGNETLWIEYGWDTDSQSFAVIQKREYAYNENGNQTLWILYDWNTDSQSFVPDYKYEYTYDANNLRTNTTFYVWYPALGVYKPSFKMDISTQSETETNIVREGISYEYDTNFNIWNELEGEEFKEYYYYTKESSLSTDIVALNSFTIYPNPTENTLFISGSESPLTISIYNVLGEEVLSVKNRNNINVEALPSGVYMIRITDGVGQTNRKFIKN